MKECKIIDNKKACLLLAVSFWGLLMFFELGGKILLKLFPRELLLEYIDPIFYGAFFLLIVIVFRKSFLYAIKDFAQNAAKYLNWSAAFFALTLVLMVASAIILDSVGIGDSSNQKAIDSAVKQYGVLQIITVCLIGPVVEEIFYRGILFGLLKGSGKRVLRSIVAILITALIFAFNHSSIINLSIIDLLANIPIFMLALTLTTLYWKTDNIFCPILVHIFINSLSTSG